MRFKALLAVGVVLFFFAGCAKDRLADKRARFQSDAERQRFSQDHHLGRLPQSDVPLTLNDRVYAWMDYFQGAGRGHFQRYLERSGRYTKMMRDILKQHGLPQDLIYVALIESGFNNNAYSRAAAVGPWQFIRGTGSRYGLDISRWVDERRDPVKATHAAARYLRDLHNEFGDWYLAMAGYNAGEGRIRNAVADSGSRNFWDIADANERYLRAETRDYVPKFIAATIMAKMPQNFGFGNVNYQRPIEYETGIVETQTDLDVVAECAGVGTDVISDLNPHLVRGATPAGARNYEVKLPKGTAAGFKAKYASLPESERVKIAYHRVKKGESIASIARRYGVPKSALIAANDISSSRHRLRSGTMLVIPRGGGGTYFADKDAGGDGERVVKGKKLVNYKVKKMDSVTKIAKRFGVTPAQVKSWNAISARNPLRAGRVIKIYQPIMVAKASSDSDKGRRAAMGDTAGDNTSHSIRSGDTLWTIAQRYGMSVDELASINGLDTNAKIKPGQKIIVKMAQGKTAIDVVEDPSTQSAAPAPSENRSLETKAEIQQNKDTAGQTIAMATAEEASPDDIDLDMKPEPKKAKTKESVAVTKKHTVKKGETLGAVARRHGVSVNDLMKWNGIKNPKGVRAGQVLKIRATEIKTAEAKTVVKPAPAAEEKIERTEEPVSKIPAANAVAPEKEQGVPLKLSDIPLPEPQSMNYKVRDGDTLWDIARRHKVTIAEIQKWNNLSDPSAVKPGDSLTINRR